MSCSVSVTREAPGRSSTSVEVSLDLAEHRRRDERDAVLGDMEALAVLGGIDAGPKPRGNLRSLVDDHAVKHGVAAHLDLGQQYGLADVAEAVHAHVRKEQRIANRRAADDAAA